MLVRRISLDELQFVAGELPAHDSVLALVLVIVAEQELVTGDEIAHGLGAPSLWIYFRALH